MQKQRSKPKLNLAHRLHPPELAIFPTAGFTPAATALSASYSHLLSHGIGLEASTDNEQISRVELGGARPTGIRDFFVDMGLEEEVEVDRLAAQGAGLGRV